MIGATSTVPPARIARAHITRSILDRYLAGDSRYSVAFSR
jgi:hypothetical protein